MAKELPITKLSTHEKILRAKNRDLSFPLTSDIKQLIANMKATVKKAPGIGLAAPQVGVNLNLAVINLEEFGVAPFALISPKVISKSIKKTRLDEGCLSSPGLFGPVKRPARVEVEAYREDGRRVVIKADGLLAKVLQHEIDHLNGILIVDKMEKRGK